MVFLLLYFAIESSRSCDIGCPETSYSASELSEFATLMSHNYNIMNSSSRIEVKQSYRSTEIFMVGWLYICDTPLLDHMGRTITTPKIRFPTCLAYQNMTFSHISYTYLQRRGRNVWKMNEMCQKCCAIRFSTCTKSKFSSRAIPLPFL